MKHTALIAIALFGLLASCSPSDDEGSASANVYLPLGADNYWNYDVTGSAAAAGRDSLFVANDTVINTKTYQKFKTGALPVGFYSNSLNGNSVRKEGSKLLLSGGAGLDVASTLPVDLNLTDFVVFDENAADGQSLSDVTDNISQTFQDIPLTIKYTLKSAAVTTLPTYTSPNGDTYTDVKSVKTTLQVKVVATYTVEGLPVPIPITILDNYANDSNLVSSTQYFAKGIGVVYSTTTISYALATAIPGTDIPQSGTQTQEEFLDTYHVEN
ncbi:hypothetical protein [Flavobacterium sp. 3HN19-14]|uniref:hypothetical protein n=1 Tax=Flavobacterium sp. 3HN19-14 TaxID=3448133 RepID=UPI003EE1DE12